MTVTRMIAVAMVVGGMGAGLSVQAQEKPEGPGAAPRGPRPNMPMNLEGTMKDMGRNFKMLKTNAADPEKREDSLRSVEMMERDAAIAKLNLPPMVQHLSGEQKAAKADEYRADITELQKALLSLEDAINTKNAEDVKKGLDALEAIMNKGHAEFIPKRQGRE